VLLVVPDMKPVMQMQLDYDVKSRTGTILRDTLYLTVHAIDSLDLARAGFGSLNWRADAIVASRTPTVTPAVASVSSAALGAALYREKGCAACHSIDGTLAGKIGPTFKGLYGASVTLTSGVTRKADDAYLRSSILNPAAEIVKGFEPGMPSFRGVLSDAQVESLVRYIRTLGARSR
jgi:mono/diheme cytochrome c family protein